MQYNQILFQNEFSFNVCNTCGRQVLYFSYFVKLILEQHFSELFSRQNHLSHNGPLILLFILTRHRGHNSRSEPSFQTNMHEQEPEFWQGILDSVSRPELSCLLAGWHVCSCKSHQIGNHSTGEQSVESHSSTPGLTLLCVIQKTGRIWKDLTPADVLRFHQSFLRAK